MAALLQQAQDLGPGLYRAMVFHDRTCAIWRGGICDCKPDVKIVPMKDSGSDGQR
jgi:hypothetical protein